LLLANMACLLIAGLGAARDTQLTIGN
jgi:hypothetical protein